jgi:hypothetical protein
MVLQKNTQFGVRESALGGRQGPLHGGVRRASDAHVGLGWIHSLSVPDAARARESVWPARLLAQATGGSSACRGNPQD